MSVAFYSSYSAILCLRSSYRNTPPTSSNERRTDRGMPDAVTCRRAGRVPRTSTSRDFRSVRGVGSPSIAARTTPCCTWKITGVCASSCIGSVTTQSARGQQTSSVCCATWLCFAVRSTGGCTSKRAASCTPSRYMHICIYDVR